VRKPNFLNPGRHICRGEQDHGQGIHGALAGAYPAASRTANFRTLRGNCDQEHHTHARLNHHWQAQADANFGRLCDGSVSGRRDGKGGLSARTVGHIHRVLKQALAQAVRWEMLIRNPANAVDPPKVERSAMRTYDITQTAALIEALRGSRMLIPVLFAALFGLRRGEITALGPH
jgi:integrase